MINLETEKENQEYILCFKLGQLSKYTQMIVIQITVKQGPNKQKENLHVDFEKHLGLVQKWE